MEFQRLQRKVQIHVGFQRHQLAAGPDLVGKVDQGLAALRLLDLVGMLQKIVEIAIFVDQQGRSFDADPRRAGDVVDTVAGQGLHVDHLVRPDTELFLDLFRADPPVLHRIDHFNAAADQLHKILVGRDDRHPSAGIARLCRKRGDDVVGLEALDLDTGQIEGPRRIADQVELRHQILRRRRSLRLVLGIDVVAEGLALVIENHRHMGRGFGTPLILDHLEDHVAEPADRPHRQSVGLSRQGRQGVISTENVSGTVD